MSKNNLIIIITCVAILIFSSCTASLRLEETRGFINMADGRTCTYHEWANLYGCYSSIVLRYRPEIIYGKWCEPARCNNFGTSGYIRQHISCRDTAMMHYRQATLHSIVIVIDDKDTLPWVMDEFRARICDSLVRYYPYLRDSAKYYNYTNDSLPLQVVTSGLDRDWELNFEGMTIPFDIQKVRKLRVEIKMQVDDYMVTRIMKARRRFLIWFEPRQGFKWRGPESAEVWFVRL